MQNKNEGSENKIMLEDLNCTMDKTDRDGEKKKTQILYRSAQITPWQNSYTDIKIANDTNINHIMVSFTNYYNNISIDRLPSKTKIVKYSWYFNNSFLCKPEVSPATKTFLFLLRNTHTQKITAAVNP